MTGILENIYREQAGLLAAPHSIGAGTIAWECPSNIALIKYWGKKPGQLPINPSLSFTLSRATTRLTLEYEVIREGRQPEVSYFFEGKPQKPFGDKFRKYLLLITPFLPFLKSMRLTINTGNSFPHSAGIASSASSFGALALALCSLEQEIYGTLQDPDDFYRKASFLARLGSGSASRSVRGGALLWGDTTAFPGSSDEAALEITREVHPVFRDYRDSILVVNSGAKFISSSAGHRLMEDHAFTRARVEQAHNHLIRLLSVLRTGDQEEFTAITEQEALTLHALMLSSNPGLILLKPETLRILELIRQFRGKTGIMACFTLDAGPNVHVLYPSASQDRMHRFITGQLARYCEHGLILHDQVGKGPVKIN
jgi:diphosphomevalonate decarboxylase